MMNDPAMNDRDFAIVDAAMRRIAGSPTPASASSASTIWREAQLLRQLAAQRRAAAPIDIGLPAIILFEALAGIVVLPTLLQAITAMRSPVIAVATGTTITLFALLGVAAAFLALRNFQSPRRTS